MSTRYRKGERFRVRSTGSAPPLVVDTSTADENAASVAAVLERERPPAAASVAPFADLPESEKRDRALRRWAGLIR